jgi:DedD protein
MQRSLRTEEFEEEEQQREIEVTLGPVMLVAILCGLLILCGICFGVGYSAGRRSSAQLAPKVTQTASGQTVTAAAGSALGKPPARGLVPPAPQQQQPAIPQPQPASAEASGSGNPFTSYAPMGDGSGAGGTAAQPAVRPALPVQGSTTAPASPNPGSSPQSTAPQGPTFMVQVAAVSRPEDATVLMNALRKRGYAVMARKGFSDGLIHVQVGPFSSQAEATAMSQKLLNDGYNAVVLP